MIMLDTLMKLEDRLLELKMSSANKVYLNANEIDNIGKIRTAYSPKVKSKRKKKF